MIQNLSAPILIIMTSTSFAISNLIVKLTLGEFDKFSLIAYRGLICVGLLALVWGKSRTVEALKTKHPLFHLVRGLVSLAFLTFTFNAVNALELATFTSIFYMSPLLIVLLSALILKEKISKVTSFAVVLSFAGLLVMMPLDGSQRLISMALAFGAALMHATTILILRYGANFDSVRTMLIYYTLMSGLGAFVLNKGALMIPSLTELLFITLISLIQLGVFYGCVLALKKSKASDIAPFEYVSLFWSVLFDIFIFQSDYSTETAIGICFIVIGSLIPLIRHRRKVRLKSA